MAYIEFTDIASDSFGAYIAGLDTNYSKSDRRIEWQINGLYHGTQVGIPAYVFQTDSYWFYGLAENTTYTVGAGITYSDGWGTETTVWVYGTCTTLSSGSGGGSGEDPGGGGETTTDGYVYIFGADGYWHRAIPYVFGADYVWHRTQPYVLGSDYAWHKIGAP